MKVDLIVSRHPAAIEWLRGQGVDAPVIESATDSDVRGKTVAGNLPLCLAAAAFKVLAIEFAGDPPRGREYTADDMVNAGAQLCAYSVLKLKD